MRVRGQEQRSRNFATKRKLKVLRRQQAREELLRLLRKATKKRNTERMKALMPRGQVLGGRDIEIEVIKAKSVIRAMERTY